MTHDAFLLVSLVCLIVALLAGFGRRFNTACTRNTISVAIDCDVDHAREGVRQLTADVERLHAQVIATRRGLAELKADREMVPLKVRNVNASVMYRTPPAPPAPVAKKKAPSKR